MPTPFTPTISKVYSIWTSGTGAVTVASPSTGPTSAQITAATDLTGYGMKGWSGGDESPQSISVPFIGVNTAAKVSTGSELNDVTISFAMDRTGLVGQLDARSLFSVANLNRTVYLVAAWGGNTSTYIAQGIQGTYSTRSYSIATGQAATFNVTITPAAVFEFALP